MSTSVYPLGPSMRSMCLDCRLLSINLLWSEQMRILGRMAPNKSAFSASQPTCGMNGSSHLQVELGAPPRHSSVPSQSWALPPLPPPVPLESCSTVQSWNGSGVRRPSGGSGVDLPGPEVQLPASGLGRMTVRCSQPGVNRESQVKRGKHF